MLTISGERFSAAFGLAAWTCAVVTRGAGADKSGKQ